MPFELEQRFQEVAGSFTRRSVGVAVSGGVDSMVLLHGLVSNGMSPVVLHVNYGLRGEDSERDEALVREFCSKRNLEIRVFIATDAPADGQGIQVWARNARYLWFDQMDDLEVVFLAHHQNDQAETVLLNLFRGSGVNGAAGMKMEMDRYVRPLLNYSRLEIEAYAERHSVDYREDRTNRESKYRRNFIRNELFPTIEQEFPTSIEKLAGFAGRMQQVRSLLDEMVVIWKADYVTAEGVQLNELRKLPHAGLVLSELLIDLGLNATQVDQILEMIERPGARLEVDSKELVVGREVLYIRDTTESGPFSIVIDGPGNWKLPTGMLTVRICEVDFGKLQPNQLVLDPEVIDFPLQLRTWRQGDRIQPFGMKGTKLVSDVLVDAKVDVPAKENVLVLTSGKIILWVVGYCQSERSKIMYKKNKVLLFEFLIGKNR